MRVYATPSDLPEPHRADPLAARLIRSASRVVTATIARAVFPTDGDGMPVGDDLTACRDAVVEQVSTWLSTGVHPLMAPGTKPRTATSKSSNGTAVAYAADTAEAARVDALAKGDTLTPAALAILADEGLTEVAIVGNGSRRLYRPVPSPDVLIDGGEG